MGEISDAKWRFVDGGCGHARATEWGFWCSIYVLQINQITEEELEFGQVKSREEWLARLAEEYIKLESCMPRINFVAHETGPKWAENLEREVGASMFPVAKLKEEFKLTTWRLAAVIGHQCAISLWFMEWLKEELKKPHFLDKTKVTPEQLQNAEEICNKLANEWYPALRRVAKRALCSCVDQVYEDSKEFLQAYAAAFAQKPSGPRAGNMGSSAFEIYCFMLIHWQFVERLNTIHHLHQVLVKVFGPYRTGDLKRTEKICQRIGLHYRKPGRPAKVETIQTPA